LYKRVLRQPLDERIEMSRAKRYQHLPTVLSVDEVRRLLDGMHGTQRLMAELTYGAGLRLLEVHRIRVGHLDLDNNRLRVLDGKGRKDRITLLPLALREPLLQQLAHVAQLHAQDLNRGLGSVVLPFAFFRKSKEASRQLHWQFLFPSPTTFVDPKTGNSGRWHVNATGLQLAVSKAAALAKLHKRVTVHTLRHSFATHLLRDGCDIRTLQVLLGHTQVNTTMVYAHIDDSFSLATRSPLDRHALHGLAAGHRPSPGNHAGHSVGNSVGHSVGHSVGNHSTHR
jgi:integron integrase